LANEASIAKRNTHLRENIALLRLFGGDISDPFPRSTVWGSKFVMWPDNIGSCVEADLLTSLGAATLEIIKNQVRLGFENEARLDKTFLFIGHLLAAAKENGGECPSLDRLLDSITSFNLLPQNRRSEMLTGSEIVS
jgi:hypothetical protein